MQIVGSRLKKDMTKIRVKWARGKDKLDFTRALIFLILGKKGSGKSALIEALGERYPKIIDLFGCYDEKTELLTLKGWKFFKDINFEDKIATLTSEGYLEYHYPIKIQKFSYDGEMIKFKGSFYDLLVTPDHNMFISPYWHPDKFQFKKAIELVNPKRGLKNFRFKRNADWAGIEKEYFELPPPIPNKRTLGLIDDYNFVKKNYIPIKERSRDSSTGRYSNEDGWTIKKLAKKLGYHVVTISKWVNNNSKPHNMQKYNIINKIPINIFLKFLGWYLAEGSLHNKERNVSIAQINIDNVHEIQSVFDEIGLKNCYTAGGHVVAYSTQFAQYCKQFGHAHEKYIPEDIKELPTPQLKILLETMMKGDGSKTGLVYFTSSKRLADDFQEIAIKCGYGATIGHRMPRVAYIRGRKIKSIHRQYVISIARKAVISQVCNKPTIEKYEGMIYDVTVPNHTLLIRRNGKSIWCGNSRDDEGLAWCRDSSPIDNILLVHGDNVDLDCSWDTCKAGNITYEKMMDYEVIIPSYSLFSGNVGRFAGINKVMDLFWDRREWTKPVYVAVREASSFIYSRIKQEGVNMKIAKADFIYWQREMRHFGYALGIDTIRWTSIDKEMRDLADWQIFKKVGPQGLPDDVDFIYRYIDPFSMAGLPPNRFVVLTENASIGWGMSACPSYHKEEGVDIIKELGIQMEYGEEILESTIQKIGDDEHSKIVKLYDEMKSMRKVSKLVHRSSERVHSHIHQHNKAIMDNGMCELCSRADSDLADVELYIGR